MLDEELSYRDRLNAFETVLSHTEPKITLTDSEAELVIAKLKELSTEELRILEKLALNRLN